MRAHQIMTRNVITVTPQTSIEEAANIMLRKHISGLPVVDADSALVGIVSESDFLRRSEIGTGRKRPAWLRFFRGPGRAATDFAFAHRQGPKFPGKILFVLGTSQTARNIKPLMMTVRRAMNRACPHRLDRMLTAIH
jgi:CBS domain containing-hemolysin-like protein